MSNSANQTINIKGARQHNLKNIDLEIPKQKFVVFTGVSGSGKSSLAMDTIYAEGQRRYVESLSAYARQFLGVMDKPDVDSIEGLSPAIAIDQKTVSHNPRSTVGTVTEIYDFLRLLYARIGHQYCTNCGREIARQSVGQIVDQMFDLISKEKDYVTERGARVLILAPVVKDRKGEFSDLFANLKKQGYARARIDGSIKELNADVVLLKTNKHSIDAVISRHVISRKRVEQEVDIRSSVSQAVEGALRLSGGTVILAIVRDNAFDFPAEPKQMQDHLFSERFACPACNLSFAELEPRSFSFNSPHGACPACHGLGTELNINVATVLNKNLSIVEGGIMPWSGIFESMGWLAKVIEVVAKESGFSTRVPLGELSEQALKTVLYGCEQERRFKVGHYLARYEGVIPNLIRRHQETKSDYVRQEIEKYMVKESCKACRGTRLKNEALSVVIAEKNIWAVCTMSVDKLLVWVNELDSENSVLSPSERLIAQPILKELTLRLRFLLDVGLAYLTIARSATELSGGEAQRIRLASQIGSGLAGVLYVLDEPSVGLHQRDQKKLIDTLKRLRDLGNTVLVVEHDAETMLESDYIFDFGPGAGEHGGTVVAQGSPREIMADRKSLTGDYLSGRKTVGSGVVKLLADVETAPVVKRANGNFLTLKGASGRNLKNITVRFPIGQITCVTGVSGSGKSTLVMDTLLKALRQEFGLKNEQRPEAYEQVEGLEFIDKVIDIDQSPIGRTPKSNPATYTKTFDHIRQLFAQTQEARIRGYQPGRFS
ncbi:excinuclease ABC subunit UvrA, partial [Patescibacteria group bacterium]|nr:excinuclease ABC subunit UvrA [Patescibacteria group bacterium]